MADVAWWPGSDSVPGGLRVFAPGGQFPAADLPQSGVPAHVAVELLGAHTRAPIRDPEPVTFAGDEAERVSLLYTAVSSPAATTFDSEGAPLVDGSSDGWLTFGDPSVVGDMRQLIEKVRDYWRQLLEETTAVFDFLPRYFTTAQVRGVYESVWGEAQDAGNFHRWLHKQNGDVCVGVEGDQVVEERDRVAAERLAEEGQTPQSPRLLATALPDGLVGSSALALSPLGVALPALSLAAGATGARVAFQAAKQRGPQPKWFTRTANERVRLDTLYGPRPVW